MLGGSGQTGARQHIRAHQRGKRQTVRNGKLMRTPVALYGYTHTGSAYEICEEEAIWVRRMFDWYCVEGLSLLAVANRLYEAGVPTKQGGRWSPTTIRNLLKQEAYYGEFWWGKHGGSGPNRVTHPRSEWIGPIAVPPIISRKIYDSAQERLQYNKINSKRNSKTEYLLSGLITCPLCGRRYAGKKAVTKKQTKGSYTHQETRRGHNATATTQS